MFYVFHNKNAFYLHEFVSCIVPGYMTFRTYRIIMIISYQLHTKHFMFFNGENVVLMTLNCHLLCFINIIIVKIFVHHHSRCSI